MAKPVKETYINITEERLNFPFPQEYKKLISEENGGSIICGKEEWELYPIADLTDKQSIAKTFNNVQKETENSKEWNLFPQAAITVGENGSGDKLVLLPNSSVVYMWFHETGELITLADSFGDVERIY